MKPLSAFFTALASCFEKRRFSMTSQYPTTAVFKREDIQALAAEYLAAHAAIAAEQQETLIDAEMHKQAPANPWWKRAFLGASSGTRPLYGHRSEAIAALKAEAASSSFLSPWSRTFLRGRFWVQQAENIVKLPNTTLSVRVSTELVGVMVSLVDR